MVLRSLLVGTMFCSAIVSAAVAQTPAVRHVFQDDFQRGHNYLTQGVEGTGWNGFLGKGAGETADRIEAADGQLFLQSTKGRYQEGWDPLGPLLYREVTGDFRATVRVVDYESLSFNNCGIMARAATLPAAGEGEDWVSVDYFPIYGGIYARMADNHRRSEKGSNGQGKRADKYLQLELIGNRFHLRHSPDGKDWQELPASPLIRNDLVNVPLQVGLFQATYSANQGQVSFANFELVQFPPVRVARCQAPKDGAENQAPNVTLSWIPGHRAGQHDLYLGTDKQQVANATRADVHVYRGRRPATEVEATLTGLEDGREYYWRVDAIDGEDTQRGKVWKFTVIDRQLADFEQYKVSTEVAKDWAVQGPGLVTLLQGDAKSGEQALRLALPQDANNEACETLLTFAESQDWYSSRFGFRSLSLLVRTAAPEAIEQLYLVFEEDDWETTRTIVPYNGALADLPRARWVRWAIDLQALVQQNPAFRLERVKRVGVGFVPAKREQSVLCAVDVDDLVLDYQRPTEEGAWPLYVDPLRFVTPVPFPQVTVTGGLWKERLHVNRTVSLPHVWRRCEASTKANGEDSKRLENFRIAAGQLQGKFTGIYFNDSDVYKILEGTAYSLRNHPDAKLQAYADQVIDWIAAAQWPDGYLFTSYSIPEKRPQARWTNVGGQHELYCAGHLIEAGVAYAEATGKRKLLDVAIRFADLICGTFGPGKREAAPGHQEIELALIRLYRLTGKDKYLQTAQFFIDQRGRGETRRLYGTYSQDHLPFVEQETGVGHSVRAGYLFCAATDIVREKHDEAYAAALQRLWHNIVNKKTYLTGGVGQPGGPEGFAGDYELDSNCYAETCSGIAFAMWNARLHQLTGDAKYVDWTERIFFNNMLGSLSAAGDCHYYTNPLVTGGRERWQWPGHDCACCPSNLVRVISSIGGYWYSHSRTAILVNHYAANRANIPLGDQHVTLVQETNYPWEEEVLLRVGPQQPAEFTLKLRIPGWARNQPLPGNLYRYLDDTPVHVTVTVNGEPVEAELDRGYLPIRRRWQAGDVVRLHLPMKPRRVITHPNALANRGLVAVERGPIVYCAEFKDNAIDVGQLHLGDDESLQPVSDPSFYGGAVTLESQRGLKLIPYYLYSNRGRGWMRVWMRRS